MKSWKLMGPFVVSASKLGAMLPRRSLRTSELSSHAETTRKRRSTYAGGRSEVEPILKRLLGLISRIWRGMGAVGLRRMEFLKTRKRKRQVDYSKIKQQHGGRADSETLSHHFCSPHPTKLEHAIFRPSHSISLPRRQPK